LTPALDLLTNFAASSDPRHGVFLPGVLLFRYLRARLGLEATDRLEGCAAIDGKRTLDREGEGSSQASGEFGAEPAAIPSTQLGLGVVGRGTENYFSTLAHCVVVDSLASAFL
jgi:hypothetical protein